jgi:hypothetical protein
MSSAVCRSRLKTPKEPEQVSDVQLAFAAGAVRCSVNVGATISNAACAAEA